MNKTMLLTATAVIALTAGAALAAAPGAVTKGTPGAQIRAPGTVLYSQNSNDAGVGLVSDIFTSGTYGSYSDSGADDFVVPAGKTWKITAVDVTGVYFNGSGPANGEVVTFYKKGANQHPGDVISSQSVSCTDSAGSFSCKLPTAVKVKGGTKGKTYWVGVQANMDFTGGRGEWGWELNSTIHKIQANWEDPGGGFGVCPSWGTNGSCLGYSGDYMFDLVGKSR